MLANKRVSFTGKKRIYMKNTESNSFFHAQELSISEREYCKEEHLEMKKCRKRGSDEELL